MQEKRKYARVREDDKISYTEIPFSKTSRMLSLDFSQGGVRFISDHFIKPQSILKIELVLERAKKVIKALAAVKWVKPLYDDEQYEVGVEFLDIDSGELQFLKQYSLKK